MSLSDDERDIREDPIMACFGGDGTTVEDAVDACPDCAQPIDAVDSCSYSPQVCDTCLYRPCDWSC